MDAKRPRDRSPWGPFLAGALTAGAGLLLLNAWGSRRRIDPRLIRRAGLLDGDVPRTLRHKDVTDADTYLMLILASPSSARWIPPPP